MIQRAHFNSIKVRLEPNAKVGASQAYNYFNSIKVRLELSKFSISSYVTLYFNSIKVRLEHMQITCLLKALPFQFHKGAIRTNFQAQLVDPSRYFNSIKVRLELSLRDNMLYASHLFQFHKGAIRTQNTVVMWAQGSISIP